MDLKPLAKYIAVGYCRFSSEKQRDGYSIEAQEDAIKEYCNKKGIQLLKFYVDEAKSAKNADRDAFQDMISDSKKHLFTMVIVHKLDRFARRRYDDVIYRQILKDNGVQLKSVCEDFDESKPSSIMLTGVISAMNEYYLANLSLETKKGLYERARKGLACSKAPIGYARSAEGKYVINEEEAPIVRELFERFSEGESMGDIAHSMKKRGIKGRLGANLCHQSIEKIIRNTLYIGTYTFSYAKESITVPNACEPLIPGDLWAKANSQLKKQSKKPFKKHTMVEYPLTGILKCGKCGSYMRGWSYKDRKGKRRSYYRCIGSTKHKCSIGVIQKDKIDLTVFQCLKDFITNEQNFAELAKEMNERIKERSREGNAKEARKTVADLARRRIRLSDAYESGAMPLDIYTDQSRNVEARYAEAKKALAVAEGPSLPKVTPSLLQAFFKYYFEKYKDAEMGTLFTMLLNNVVVYEDRMTINWKIKSPDQACIAYRELSGLEVARKALQQFSVSISIPLDKGYDRFMISRKKDYSYLVSL